MFRSYPDVMTVKQLAAALGIGINKAYEIVNDGTINSKRIGRRILIPKLYLVDYIQQTRYNKNRLGGKSRFSGVSRLSCYYRVNSSVFIGL